MTTIESLSEKISAVRHFNRFFTRKIGVLREGLLHSPYPLTDARILYEIAHHEELTASQLCHDLGLDPGYLSRILLRLEEQGLVERLPSQKDGRQRIVHLTQSGQDAFEILDRRSAEEISEFLNDLNPQDQNSLVQSMQTIEMILGKKDGMKYSQPFILRPPEPGDMGWVVHRHGFLYAKEYGWDDHFEALVAQIVADFVQQFNPVRERCWIAEMEHEIVGSVFVVQADEVTAKLRLLLVEPKARGLGLGSSLVEECIRFTRRAHYQKMVLWTNSVLLSARSIYQKSGFRLVQQEPHHSYGQDLVGETWEIEL